MGRNPRSIPRAIPLALLASSLLSLCLWSLPTLADDQAGWQKVKERDGIVSLRRERPGQSLAAFRARTSVPADMWMVLAVLEDVDRANEWTAHCLEMRKLRGDSARDMLVYARTDAPWPVRDRDVVTRVTTRVLGLTDVVVDIHAVPHLPERAGLVRIPTLDARYVFHKRPDGLVQIEYTIEVDPGGTLPDWVKNLVGRDLAHETLARLRKRAEWALAQGTYAARASTLRSIADAVVAARSAVSSEMTFTNAGQ